MHYEEESTIFVWSRLAPASPYGEFKLSLTLHLPAVDEIQLIKQGLAQNHV